MQQRQLRLGDILDDYCPRERRLTNHAVVAMIGEEVKQTRCTTCDAEHEYKHARVPKQRRKTEPAALYAHVAAGAPKKVVHDVPFLTESTEPVELAPESIVPIIPQPPVVEEIIPEPPVVEEEIMEAEPVVAAPSVVHAAANGDDDAADFEEGIGERIDASEGEPVEDGPVHRPLIRAQLPRIEGQPPAPRQTPDFTIRQPGGRQNRFRPRQPRGGQGFQGNRGNGNVSGFGNMRGSGSRPHGGRPPHMSHPSKRQGPQGAQGRKRSK